MPTCIDWAQERTEECTETRDEGFNECTDWDEQCCDWWPCSWACEAVTLVCLGWHFVSNVVCVTWTGVTSLVCIAWDAFTTLVNAIGVTIESFVGWFLSGV